MTGNFIADDIPRIEEKDVPHDIMKGIVLHRRIDEFTDKHDSFHKAVEKLRPHHRKYAPVVIDILNDHLLSLNWATFFEEPEGDFHTFAYGCLTDQVERLPSKASLHVEALLEHRYLMAYSTKEGLENILTRMDRRTRFPSDFAAAADHLYAYLDFYNELFLELYEDLLELVSSDATS